jgi:CheY-like chemotaxis protein
MAETTVSEPTKILIVDDDSSVRDVITVLLGEEGYVCTAVNSAEAALDAVRHAEYPLVISDVRMPG